MLIEIYSFVVDVCGRDVWCGFSSQVAGQMDHRSARAFCQLIGFRCQVYHFHVYIGSVTLLLTYT